VLVPQDVTLCQSGVYFRVFQRSVVPSTSGSRNASHHSAVAYTVIISLCYLEFFYDILSRRLWS